LRILSCATAFIVLFALSPTYLKFRRLNQSIYVNVAVAALLHILLLVFLVPRWGPTGAAVSYAVAMAGMYGNMARLARREFTALRAP
jgi:O-antigen/teichoic acid export membrane protein